uniref:Uncharacterized protein n=1 Tax=Ditylenchus dipsaci TaxID=166011 RepID=A0A915EII1_9BILA
MEEFFVCIEFDKDGEYFVIAGVTKKIKLYDYNAVINQNSNTHYPVEQLQCSSKISNVSWNPYNKSLLASSDYEGTVQLWDTAVGKATRTLKEHEKRCWTVQFNNVDPHLMASGSDDAKVKLWCSKNHLVFGSADHCVHLYDIRNPSKPLNIFRGHRKAVSYVKYCNESEVVSASTDSNLRVWDVNSGKCLQTMRGHQNEKNFVGLATDGNHVSISEPLMSFDFALKQLIMLWGQQPALQIPISVANSTDFVSAVCWKKNTNVIVAANSQGTTHILQLQ